MECNENTSEVVLEERFEELTEIMEEIPEECMEAEEYEEV